eukprot:TRINITY_DN10056_c0_g1_i2.p1 TRINITY_DN10056_c0_g1~~TRINITY_DN10056_c0_g1_i2.p1  ORF type:complete len:431 (-),score=78.23 TRINITY_DN10056_c0_g1_i2:169-1281(-)
MEASLISSMFQIGITASGLVLGSISDRVGRIPVFLLEECGIVCSLAAIIFVNNYTACLVFTALCGFFSFAPLCYSFAYDWNHSKNIGFYAFFIGIMYAVGGLVVALIMWAGARWRTACVCTVVVCMAYLIFPWLIEDSPKYYYSKGKVNCAMNTFKRVGKVNGKEMTRRFILKDESTNLTKAATFCEQIKLIMQKWMLYRLGICCCIYFVCGFIYFGLSLNVGKFVGNTYVNAICNGIAEILGVTTIYFISRYKGSYFPFLGSYILTFIALVVQYFSHDYPVVTNCAMYVGKFSISGGFTIAYTLTGKLFPTAVNTTCIAILAFCERIGAIISPIVGNSPTVFIGMAAVCSFVAVIAIVVLYWSLKDEET